MSEQFDSIYWSGQGPCFLSRRDSSGNPLGFKFVGDVSAVELTANIDRTSVYENVSGGRNEAASWTNRTEYQVQVTFKSVKPEHLKEVVQGTVTTKAAGSVTDQSVNGYHDLFVKLGHVKVSSVVVTSDPAGTTYTENDDYIVHGDEGMLEILSTGTIGDGDALLVDYDYAAQKEVKAAPGAEDLILLLPGINRANSSKRGRLTLHKINLDPGALSAIVDGDQETSMPVGGRALFDSLRSEGDQLYSWEMED